MKDRETPKPVAKTRSTAKRNAAKSRTKEHLFSNIEVRFVYENELMGTWFSLEEAIRMGVPIIPNDEFRVIRVQFRDKSELG